MTKRKAKGAKRAKATKRAKVKVAVRKPKPIKVKKTDAEKKQSAKEKRRAEGEDIAVKGTESAYYRTWLRGHLRRSFRKWPSYISLNMNTKTILLKAKDKRGTERWLKHKQCAICDGWYKLKDLAQDHILPCGSLLNVEPAHVGQFVLNMFCSRGNLRWVCDYTLKDAAERFEGRKSCHWAITHNGGNRE